MFQVPVLVLASNKKTRKMSDSHFHKSFSYLTFVCNKLLLQCLTRMDSTNNGHRVIMNMSESTKRILIKSGSHSKGSSSKMARFSDLMNVIQEMNEKEFTGYIKINFSQGGIGRIEKYEEILRGVQTAE